jgi:HD superfamily phosphohydrolase
MAHVLLRSVRDNRFSQYQVFGDELQDRVFALVVRLAALVHDLHEFPLSHTLEKEGNMFGRQWTDEKEIIRILGEESDIFQSIMEYALELLNTVRLQQDVGTGSSTPEPDQKKLTDTMQISEDSAKTLARQFAATLVVYVYRLLKSPEADTNDVAKKIFKDEKVLIKDLIDERFVIAANQIVANSVSADLLDYATRDFYFCGVNKTYDKRFLRYAVITDNSLDRTGRVIPVFAYRLISRRQEMKQSVLSSLFDVLELRYSLAEVVHYNRDKTAFSAMAIEAFNFCYQMMSPDERKEFEETIMQMGDEELLSNVRTRNKVSGHILSYYFRGKPYDEFVLWSGWGDPNTINEPALKYHLWNPRQRFFLERTIVRCVNDSALGRSLSEGDCLVYAMPSPAELYKELDTYVVCVDDNNQPKVEKMSALARVELYHQRPHMMSAVAERVIRGRDELISKYKTLWHTSLFLSPVVSPSSHALIAKLVEELFALVHCDVDIQHTQPVPAQLYARLERLRSDSRRYDTFEQLFGAF